MADRPRSVQSEDLTPLLVRWQRGDGDAFDRVIDAAYGELKRLAHARLLREGQGHTLETTGLVHEAWMRLVRVEHVSWNDRNHFLSMASRIMRRILIDHARRRYAQKRDGETAIAPDDDPPLLSAGQATTVLELDQAIEHLEAVHARPAQILELHYFGGLSQQEVAVILGISQPTVARDLRFALAWLAREWQP